MAVKYKESNKLVIQMYEFLYDFLTLEGKMAEFNANSTFTVEAPDSCPITVSDIVLACPRSIQDVGTLVRHVLRLEASANRVTVSSVDCFRVEGMGDKIQTTNISEIPFPINLFMTEVKWMSLGSG